MSNRVIEFFVCVFAVAGCFSVNAGTDAPCTEDSVKLGTPVTVAVTGTSKVVALLNCQATNAGDIETVVAVSANPNIDAPMCSSRVKLIDKSGNFFLGKIKSAEVRTFPDKSLLIVPTLAGGASNDSWTSQAFIRMDDKCNLTLLAKLYSRMHYDEDDSSKCEGARHVYRFTDDSTVEVRRDRIHCTATEEKVETTTTKLDLEVLTRKPELRILEP